MDPAGARALARRIEEGKPQAEITSTAQPEGTAATGHLDDEPQAISENGVVLVRPRAARRRGEVRVFVRAADGRLHRLF
jgi:hypothetical protein